MRENRSAYRITWLLYLGVLVIPIIFFYTYNAMKALEGNTAIIRQLTKSGGEMLALTCSGKEEKTLRTKEQIGHALQNLGPWFEENNQREFYVGGKSLLEDYNGLMKCWGDFQKTPNQTSAMQCWSITKSLSFSVEKMLILEQNKITNLLYTSVLLALIFLLLLIVLIRGYIHKQLQKDSIYDLPTKLFNGNFYNAELKKACDYSLRHHTPLSLLSIEAANFDDKGHDEKGKENILKKIGGLLISLTRSSDIACHYDENHFMVILPGTTLEGAIILEQRIKEALEDHDFGVYPSLLFKTSLAQFDGAETAEVLTRRTLRHREE